MLKVVFVGVIIISCSVFQVLYGKSRNENVLILPIGINGFKQIVNISGNSSTIIQVIDIPSTISSLIFEVHSQIENVTLSGTAKAAVGRSVTGKNVGMVRKLQNSESEALMWLLYGRQKNISLLLQIKTLDAYGPVPGGCNMEFPTEVAPYMRLKSDSQKIYLEYQHANVGSSRDQPEPVCHLSSPYITYEVYVSFLKENDFGEVEYFNKIVEMSNTSLIKLYSSKVKTYSVHPNTRYVFLKYPNVGAVYNVIAKYTINDVTKEAAYVPAATYGCDFSEFTEYGCRVSYAVNNKLFLFLFSFYGFVVTFFGHSFLGATVFFFGFSSSFFVGFILLQRFSDSFILNSIEFTELVGVLGAAIWLFLWLWFPNALIPLLLLGCVLGFLLTATVFYSPLGNFEIFMNDKNYFSLLSTGTLFVAFIFLAFPTFLIILSSSVVGSYIMLLYYDDFIGTRLAYIILNVVKRSITKDLGFASNDYPFQAKDIAITTAWIVLSFFAVVFQWRKQSVSPFAEIRNNKMCCLCFPYTKRSANSRLSSSNSEFQNDQQPLLSHNHVHYQTFPG